VKNQARIESWWVITVDTLDHHLVGLVYGHPHLKQGARAVTTRILKMDDHTAETENTIYALGEKGEGKLPGTWKGDVNKKLAIDWGLRLLEEEINPCKTLS